MTGPTLLWLLTASLLGCKDGDGDDDGPTDDTAGDGGDGGTAETYDLVLPLQGYVEDLAVEAGREVRFSFTLDEPGLVPAMSALTIDLVGSMAYASFTPAAVAPPGPTGLVASGWARSGPLGMASPCSSGECWGEVTLTVDTGGEAGTVSPEVVDASVNQLEHLETGQFQVCVGLTSPVAGTLSASHLAVQYSPEPECLDDPGDFAGTWQSEFTCVDCRGQQYTRGLTLTVSQDGDQASYTDTEGGSYSGTICGDTLTYNGGGFGWTESGRFVLEGPDSASKRSTYEEACCTITCTDSLERTAGGA